LSSNYICSPKDAAAFCARVFQGYGIGKSESVSLAEALVDNEIRGIKSHGLLRVRPYLNQYRSGMFVSDSEIRIVRETPLTAVLDGNNGIGMVIAGKAVEIARKKAAEMGMGCVCVRHSNHCGALGYWSTKLAGEDMIGVSASNTPPILSAPSGSSPAIGSNPFSVCVPAGDSPAICLDISNGVMALGKVHEYRRLGRSFPEGSWLDKDGNPTNDPNANPVEQFIMRPVGMHKGFGLAVIVEIMTSLLSGGEYGTQIAESVADTANGNPTSHFFFAMRVDQFQDLEAFRRRIDEFIGYLHALPVREGQSMVLFPGEPEARAKAAVQERGLILPEDLIRDLRELAAGAGVDPDSLGAVPAPEGVTGTSQI